MNAFDVAILTYLTSFSDRYPAIDGLFAAFTQTPLIKGACYMAFYMGFWFIVSPRQRELRSTLVASFVAALAAAVATRVSSVFFPYRPRPLHVESLGLHFSNAVGHHTLDGWNSFPSDTAGLTVALATGLFLCSRRIGIVMYLFTIFVVCLPRVYLGLHYPSDVVAGSIYGLVFVYVFNLRLIKNFIATWAFWAEENYRPWFYGVLFLVAYQTAVLFYDARVLARALLAFVR